MDPRDLSRGRSEARSVRACLFLQEFCNILSPMKVIRTAKLKLTCSPEQAARLQGVTSAYRDAQNHCSRWAFHNGKTSSGSAPFSRTIELQSSACSEARFGSPAASQQTASRYSARSTSRHVPARSQ